MVNDLKYLPGLGSSDHMSLQYLATLLTDLIPLATITVFDKLISLL